MLSEAEAAVEFVPASSADPISLAELFPRDAPFEVDLGCGDGSFLAELASQRPDRNYLGVERLFGRVRTTCRRITRLGLTNARVMRGDIAHAVAQLLPRNSVDAFHIMFPDPWPKRRHHCRRIFNPDLLSALAGALKPFASVSVVTDQPEYFAEMERVVSGSHLFERFAVPEAPLAQSTFERRYVEAGEPIYRLELRKISDPR
jgi:tRNA (guanine-N7-)-methyltransferase